MNAEKGGAFRMSFENCFTEKSHSFGGTYVAIKPIEFLKSTDKFDDPNLPGEMTTSVSLQETIAGTELTIFRNEIPAAIPAELCYLGWQGYEIIERRKGVKGRGRIGSNRTDTKKSSGF